MKKILLVGVTVLAIVLTLSASQTVRAAYNPFSQACTASGGQGNVCEEVRNNPNQDPNGSNSIYGKGGLLAKALTILNILVGAVSVIMVIVGGLKYILSGGDSNSTNNARDTILYALIGLAVAVSGQLIVTFVLNKL